MGKGFGTPAAALAGVALCLLALAAWRLPTSGSPPGLDLRLIAVPPGELTVSPVGVVASARAMQAGDGPASGRLELTNIAGRTLRVTPLALPSRRGLAHLVQMRISAGDAVLAAGRLDSLAHDERAIYIPARASRRLEVSAWLPAEAHGYRGLILDVTLEFSSRPKGRR